MGAEQSVSLASNENAINYRAGVLQKHKSCSQGALTSVVNFSSGPDEMKRHIRNHRVGKIIDNYKSFAKGIQQKVILDVTSGDKTEILMNISQSLNKDPKMKFIKHDMFMEEARVAFSAGHECKTVQQVIEYWENDLMNVKLYFMFLFGKQGQYKSSIVLTDIKLINANVNHIYCNQIFSTEAIGAEGGCGGSPFSQSPENYHHCVRKIMVRYGDIIDRIQITTGTIDDQDLQTWPFKGAGGGGCSPEYFYVLKGDYIDGVRVQIANWGTLKVAQGFEVHLKYQNKWHTVVRKRSDHSQLRYLHTKTWSSAGVLVGIHGRSGDVMDALGFFFGQES